MVFLNYHRSLHLDIIILILVIENKFFSEISNFIAKKELKNKILLFIKKIISYLIQKTKIQIKLKNI
jgi:hypothetical protein